MNLTDEIKNLVLTYFQRIDSKIIEEQGSYVIHIPKKHHADFESSKIIICFDAQTASKLNCELIIPGSRTLDKIIKKCTSMGPIVPRRSKLGKTGMWIRYHFYVNFSGKQNISKLDYVDVDLVNFHTIKISNTHNIIDLSVIDMLNPKKITPTYMIAIDKIKEQCSEMEKSFVSKSNDLFRHDVTTFTNKYELRIRELNKKIHKKEHTSNNFDKIKKFRFDVIETIKHLEIEKNNLNKILQEKHKIILNYDLIACEIIAIGQHG